ncbi:MAG: PhoH family protein [Nitrospinae bacterium]|nr:PhoH family protein [Nitrospinota bacterium]
MVTDSGKRTVEIPHFEHFRDLCGINDEHLRFIEKVFNVGIVARNDSINIAGSEAEVQRVSDLLAQLDELLSKGASIPSDDMKFIIRYFYENRGENSVTRIFSDDVRVQTARKVVVPRTIAQRSYVHSLLNTDIVVAIGPAGTGKTYLAMAVAVNDLLKKKIARIVLTRPAVEAGESLGYLPGDLNEKITPYLRPLYDAIYDLLGPDKLRTMMEQGQIEVAPLAYMRGRTLNDSFIILDEAQNCTSEQMKMFLTRLGTNSKAAITGDVTQIDLPRGRPSGLVEARNILAGVEGIDIIFFSRRDVVRHSLVEKIIRAYEGLEESKAGEPE